MTALFSAAFLLVPAALASGQICLDEPVYIGASHGQLAYDDGSAYWLTWHGLYRGVWFNLADFTSTPDTWEADNTEFWFYHHSSYPWDTPCFYAEVYNGDASGPVTQLDQTSVTANHYAAVYANYSTPLICDDQFWVIVNTEMSSGGWPSLLSDGTAIGVDHSFYSDDFIVWQPWVPSTVGLDRATWAEVKTLFDVPRYRSTPGCVDYFIRTSEAIWSATGTPTSPSNR